LPDSLSGCMQLSRRDNGECSLYHYGSYSPICEAYEIIFSYNVLADLLGQ